MLAPCFLCAILLINVVHAHLPSSIELLDILQEETELFIGKSLSAG